MAFWILYLWAATCTAMIAFIIPTDLGRPHGIVPRIIGSIILGLLWPFSLLLHLTDVR